MLKEIAENYSALNYNSDNYFIGGGLDGSKFASNRHEDARNDSGKLTLGELTALLKKVTKIDIDVIKSVINYAVPNMEWHHAGKLPKQYGGGMKKTYFLNAKEICDIATNFEDYKNKVEIAIVTKKAEAEAQNTLVQRQLDYLKGNATKFSRVSNLPQFYTITESEMNGKYGWFDASGKSYSLPIYYSGWEFKNQEDLNNYHLIR